MTMRRLAFVAKIFNAALVLVCFLSVGITFVFYVYDLHPRWTFPVERRIYLKNLKQDIFKQSFQPFEDEQTSTAPVVKVETIVRRNNTCEIPSLSTFPPYEKKTELTKGCFYEENIGYLKNDEELVLHSEFKSKNCCVVEILPGISPDETFTLTECTPFELNQTGEPLEGGEVVAISCEEDRFINFEVAIQSKPEVRDKLTYWQFEDPPPNEDEPVSVLIFGFDTTSRAHAYKSLPKTIEFMKKQLGFIDFQNYHSLAPNTYENLLGLLTGLTADQFQDKCGEELTGECPLIWQKYHREHYITNFVQDTPENFNLSGHFTQNPNISDYFIPHLFSGMEYYRNLQRQKYKLDRNTNEWKMDCMSKMESVPQFLLRYTLRFATKFQITPFFSFTWFNSPFNRDVQALAAMDKHLLNFMQSIKELEAIRKRTLIIFVGTSGEAIKNSRNAFNEAPEIAYDRLLPPLFIRLPEILQEKHPDMFQALKVNSKKLTTAFDIHHTLLHILSLNKALFYSQVLNRTSLLVKVEHARNCSSTSITKSNCLCNVYYPNTNVKQK